MAADSSRPGQPRGDPRLGAVAISNHLPWRRAGVALPVADQDAIWVPILPICHAGRAFMVLHGRVSTRVSSDVELRGPNDSDGYLREPGGGSHVCSRIQGRGNSLAEHQAGK